MTDTLTAAGLQIKTLDVRIQEIKDRLRADISANLYLGTDSPYGQTLLILAEEIQRLAELLQEVHGAMDPGQATGTSLAALCAITGTNRQEATKGTVTLTVNLDGGTTLDAGSIAAVATDSTNTWVTDVAVVAPAGPAADYPVAATAGNAGNYPALAGTITTIVTAVAGWNTVTNSSDADAGLDEQTDTDLRDTRETEVTQGGSTSASAIQANLSQIDGVQSVTVYENELHYAQSGRPPKSIEATIWDGSPPAADNADIVEAIYNNKAAGIQAYGNTSVQYTDSQGEVQTIGFSRTTLVNILVDITIIVGSDYVGDAAVQTAIAAHITDTLGVADAVRRSDIIAVVEALDGVEYTDFSAGPLLSRKPAAVGATDIVLTDTEKAWVDVIATDIVVTS
jgi:uncharacterized phage protein gp47/JayE